jgi:hypothetical protein
MATVVCILDRDDWQANTDNIVVADPARRLLTWVPRDLWCPALNDRVNTAFARGGHEMLLAALAELGLRVSHSLCLRRRAAERALAGLSITVPVPAPLDMVYPLAPRTAVEDGHKIVSFRPPAERLQGERVHQWIGARRVLLGPSGDLARIARQQVFVRRLLEERFDFAAALAEADDQRLSSPAALAELEAVRAGWRMAALDAVRPALIAGKEVLLRKRGLERWLAATGPGRFAAAVLKRLRDWLLGRVLVIPSCGVFAPGRRVRLLAVLAVRDEEKYLPGFLANVAPHVDGIVALDDGSRDGSVRLLRAHPAVLEVLTVPADRPAWDEAGNFRRLQAAALRHGGQWLVALDADERVERDFRSRAERVIRRCRRLGLGAVTLRLRELWGTPDTYRCDGPWGRKRVPRLFAALPDHRFDPRPLHSVKAPLQARVLGAFAAADLEIYHLRTLDREGRAARRDRYQVLDPDARWQPGIGYDYLIDERGLRLRRVAERRRFREDGHVGLA